MEQVKKILVIGCKGMAGHVIFDSIKDMTKHNVFGIARNIKETSNVFNLDIKDTDRLISIILEYRFDIIINCIGILNRNAEDYPAKAIWANSYFPHFLEELTKDTSTKVIQISTDCVFSGKKGGYIETDFKDGVGFYAESKALGELDNKKDLTIRTSIIGPELNKKGIGLFNWFMNQSKEDGLEGYAKAFWSGITTIELSKVLLYVIENDLSGIVQVAPKNKIDKYSLLKLFNKVFRNDEVDIAYNDKYNVDKSLVSIREDFKYNVLDYTEMLYEMKEWITTKGKYHYDV